MGADLSKVSTKEVADHVKNIAKAYQVYVEAIEDNAINGAFIFDMHRKGKITILFDDLGVKSETHRERITKHFADSFPAAATTAGEGSPIAALIASGGNVAVASGATTTAISSSKSPNIAADGQNKNIVEGSDLIVQHTKKYKNCDCGATCSKYPNCYNSAWIGSAFQLLDKEVIFKPNHDSYGNKIDQDENPIKQNGLKDRPYMSPMWSGFAISKILLRSELDARIIDNSLIGDLSIPNLMGSFTEDCPLCQLGSIENANYKSRYWSSRLLYYPKLSHHPLDHCNCDCKYFFWGKHHERNYGNLMKRRIKGYWRCTDRYFGLGSRFPAISQSIESLTSLSMSNLKSMLNSLLDKAEQFRDHEKVSSFKKSIKEANENADIGRKTEDPSFDVFQEAVKEWYMLQVHLLSQIEIEQQDFPWRSLINQLSVTIAEFQKYYDEALKLSEASFNPIAFYERDFCEISKRYLELLLECIRGEDHVQIRKELSHRRNPQWAGSSLTNFEAGILFYGNDLNKLLKWNSLASGDNNHNSGAGIFSSSLSSLPASSSSFYSGGGSSDSSPPSSSCEDDWWKPAKKGLPTTKLSSANEEKIYFWIIKNPIEEASIRFQEKFPIEKIYRKKELSYIKRRKLCLKVAPTPTFVSSLKPQTITIESSRAKNGDEYIVTFQRTALKSNKKGDKPLFPYFYNSKKDYKNEKSFKVNKTIGESVNKMIGNGFQYEYTQEIVKGYLEQFKSVVVDDDDDDVSKEPKRRHIDRYYQDESLNYLFQACFFDRFNNYLPRNGKEFRGSTYKSGRGTYLTNDAELRLPDKIPAADLDEEDDKSAAVDISSLDWPISIKTYEMHYKVNHDKFRNLIERLKAKKRHKSITVFISSPFDGCDDERNKFKVKIESLRSHCSKKGIFLKIINFQWGITDYIFKENKTILHCLRAVDAADIFIGYFGARYGTSASKPNGTWIPESLAVVEGTREFHHIAESYKDRSVTEMEWQQAFLHDDFQKRPDKSIPFFLFRSKKYDRSKLADLKNVKVDFIDPKSRDNKLIIKAKDDNYYAVQDGDMISRLKDEVRSKAYPSYAAVMSSVDEEDYLDPEQGAEIMYHCCNTLVRDIIKDLKIDDFGDAQLNQLAFINSRLTFYSDWNSELKDKINSFINGNSVTPLVITGYRGSGKSSLLIKTADILESRPEIHVITHFCGCDRSSQMLPCLLERLWKDFKLFLKDRIFENQNFEAQVTKANDLVSDIKSRISTTNPLNEETFNEILKSMDAILCSLDSRFDAIPTLVLIIDGIDQIEDIKYKEGGTMSSNFPSRLNWMPLNFKYSKIKLIVSCLKSAADNDVFSVFSARQYRIEEIPRLERSDDKERILRTWHAVYLKDYDSKYFDVLLKSQQCEEMMFLSLILNQMQIRGTYDSVSEKYLVEELLRSKNVPSLIGQIMKRNGEQLKIKYSLEVDILKDVVSYIYCSRGGLTNDELLALLSIKHPNNLKECGELLSSIKKENELPSILCYRGESELLTVEHIYVMEAIESTYILDGNTFKGINELLNICSDSLDRETLENKGYNEHVVYFFQERKQKLEKLISEGKSAIQKIHVELAIMFDVRSGKFGKQQGDEHREMQELEYHQREADMRPSVIVAVRCRPLNTSSNSQSTIEVSGNTVLLKNPNSNYEILDPPPRFNFVFDENADQDRLYNSCGKDIVRQVLSGNNSSIIAFGQTGSGKTYTMIGPEGGNLKKGNLGLVPNIVRNVLDELESRENATLGWQWQAECTAVQVYKEGVIDLLDSNQSVLKSQLTKADSANVDISLTSIEKEMKNEDLTTYESLEREISKLDNECKDLSLKCFCKQEGCNQQMHNCPCYKLGQKMFNLKDIRSRYDVVKSGVLGNKTSEGNCQKMLFTKRLVENGFDNIDLLNAYLLDESNNLGRAELIKLRESYYEAFPIMKTEIDHGLSYESNVLPTYNVEYKYSELIGRSVDKVFRGKAISDFRSFMELMEKIFENRKSEATCYNETSSRSHLVITLKITRWNQKLMKERKDVKVNLVDLAGSESPRKIGCDRIEETVSTNKSLLALKRCIKALSNKKKCIFFPFRESLLTKLLQDSLAGLKNKLILIGTVSCADVDYEETKSTLKYVSLATNIHNGREIINERLQSRLKLENDDAKQELCSKYSLPQEHITLLNNFYRRSSFQWTKELARWNNKLEQFENELIQPIAWIRRFTAKCTDASEPRYLKVRQNETFICSISFVHVDTSGLSQVLLVIDDSASLPSSQYSCLISEIHKTSDSKKVVDSKYVTMKAPAESGLYMLRAKMLVASSVNFNSSYTIPLLQSVVNSIDRIDDFIAWIKVDSSIQEESASGVAEFGLNVDVNRIGEKDGRGGAMDGVSLDDRTEENEAGSMQGLARIFGQLGRYLYIPYAETYEAENICHLHGFDASKQIQLDRKSSMWYIPTDSNIDESLYAKWFEPSILWRQIFERKINISEVNNSYAGKGSMTVSTTSNDTGPAISISKPQDASKSDSLTTSETQMPLQITQSITESAESASGLAEFGLNTDAYRQDLIEELVSWIKNQGDQYVTKPDLAKFYESCNYLNSIEKRDALHWKIEFAVGQSNGRLIIDITKDIIKYVKEEKYKVTKDEKTSGFPESPPDELMSYLSEKEIFNKDLDYSQSDYSNAALDSSDATNDATYDPLGFFDPEECIGDVSSREPKANENRGKWGEVIVHVFFSLFEENYNVWRHWRSRFREVGLKDLRDLLGGLRETGLTVEDDLIRKLAPGIVSSGSIDTKDDLGYDFELSSQSVINTSNTAKPYHIAVKASVDKSFMLSSNERRAAENPKSNAVYVVGLVAEMSRAMPVDLIKKAVEFWKLDPTERACKKSNFAEACSRRMNLEWIYLDDRSKYSYLMNGFCKNGESCNVDSCTFLHTKRSSTYDSLVSFVKMQPDQTLRLSEGAGFETDLNKYYESHDLLDSADKRKSLSWNFFEDVKQLDGQSIEGTSLGAKYENSNNGDGSLADENSASSRSLPVKSGGARAFDQSDGKMKKNSILEERVMATKSLSDFEEIEELLINDELVCNSGNLNQSLMSTDGSSSASKAQFISEEPETRSKELEDYDPEDFNELVEADVRNEFYKDLKSDIAPRQVNISEVSSIYTREGSRTEPVSTFNGDFNNDPKNYIPDSPADMQEYADIVRIFGSGISRSFKNLKEMLAYSAPYINQGFGLKESLMNDLNYYDVKARRLANRLESISLAISVVKIDPKNGEQPKKRDGRRSAFEEMLIDELKAKILTQEECESCIQYLNDIGIAHIDTFIACTEEDFKAGLHDDKSCNLNLGLKISLISIHTKIKSNLSPNLKALVRDSPREQIPNEKTLNEKTEGSFRVDNSSATGREKLYEFQGPSDGDNEATQVNAMFGRVDARFIRIRPKTWNENISMRVGVIRMDGSILNPPLESRFYSSVYKEHNKSLLHSTSSAWCAEDNDINQWLVMSLGSIQPIIGLVTQCRAGIFSSQRVETFTIEYSVDGATYNFVPNLSVESTFAQRRALYDALVDLILTKKDYRLAVFGLSELYQLHPELKELMRGMKQTICKFHYKEERARLTFDENTKCYSVAISSSKGPPALHKTNPNANSNADINPSTNSNSNASKKVNPLAIGSEKKGVGKETGGGKKKTPTEDLLQVDDFDFIDYLHSNVGDDFDAGLERFLGDEYDEADDDPQVGNLNKTKPDIAIPDYKNMKLMDLVVLVDNLKLDRSGKTERSQLEDLLERHFSG